MNIVKEDNDNKFLTQVLRNKALFEMLCYYAKLTPNSKERLRQKYIENLTYDEIALNEHTSTQNIKTSITRAREKIKSVIFED